TRLFVSVFAGLDRQNGQKWLMLSDSVDAKTWHAGNIIVSNPEPGCSSYLWKSVNEYSYHYGFNDGVDHGTADAVELGQYCYDISDEALQCADIEFPSDAPTSTCGVFGDPHIVMFNGNGVTCGNDSRITLVDNEWFSLSAETKFVAPQEPATEMHSI